MLVELGPEISYYTSVFLEVESLDIAHAKGYFLGHTFAKPYMTNYGQFRDNIYRSRGMNDCDESTEKVAEMVINEYSYGNFLIYNKTRCAEENITDQMVRDINDNQIKAQFLASSRQMGLANISGNILLTYPIFVDNVVESDTKLLNGFMSVLLDVKWEDYFDYAGSYLVFDTYGKAQFWKIKDNSKLPIIERVVQNTLLYHGYITQFENQKVGIDDLEDPLFTHINYEFWNTAFANA